MARKTVKTKPLNTCSRLIEGSDTQECGKEAHYPVYIDDVLRVLCLTHRRVAIREHEEATQNEGA